MLPDRVSNPGPLTYESGALPTKTNADKRKYSFKNYLPQNEKAGNEQQFRRVT